MKRRETVENRLRQIQDENNRLKQLVADLTLDCEALKALIRKKRWNLPL